MGQVRRGGLVGCRSANWAATQTDQSVVHIFLNRFANTRVCGEFFGIEIVFGTVVTTSSLTLQHFHQS